MNQLTPDAILAFAMSSYINGLINQLDDQTILNSPALTNPDFLKTYTTTIQNNLKFLENNQDNVLEFIEVVVKAAQLQMEKYNYQVEGGKIE